MSATDSRPAAVSLDSAVEGFLEDVARAGSARSADTYRTALARFGEYLDQRLRRARRLPRRKPDEPLLRPDLADLAVEDAVEFGRWLDDYMARERGRAPSQSMLFTYTSAVQSFYVYLHREKLRRDLDLEELRERLRRLRGRREKRLPRVPADSVVEALCRAAAAVPHSDDGQAELIRLRDIALLECLRSSGMRVSEAVSLRREDLSLDDRSAVVRGKGSKERVVFLSGEAIAALTAYWEARRDAAHTGHVSTLPAFARHDDRSSGKVLPFSAKGVRRAIERLRARAGADFPVTPHRLRAWFATHMLDCDGVNLAEVQDLLGHENANTTRIYTKVRARRLQEAHRRAFGDGAS